MKRIQIKKLILSMLVGGLICHLTGLSAIADECLSPYGVDSPYGVEPRAEEIYMLELINRARSNPDAEAARYGIDLNEGVSAGSTITNAPKPPLAFNLKLHQSALAHSNDMLENDYFEHETASDNSSPKDRALLQEYDEYSGENIAINRSTGPLGIDQENTEHHHAMLFVDEDYPNRGHRVNMLSSTHVEGGVGIAYGDYIDDIRYWPNAVASTTDFGRGESPAYICGVIYDDKDGDGFYDVGEGLPNVTLTILESGESVYGFSAGAYSLPMTTQGSFTLEAYLCDHDARAIKIVEMGSENIKVDFLLSDFRDSSGSPVVTVSGTPSDNCATISTNEMVLPQTEAEMSDSPVQLSSPSSFFFKKNDLTVSVDIPCHTDNVDIYLALYTVDGLLYFATEGNTLLTTEFLPLIVNTTQPYQATFTADDMLSSLLGVYWLIVPTNNGDASTIDFGGKLQLGYMDVTPLW